MKTLALIITCCSFVGCAQFGTYQVDNSYDPKTGKLLRSIKTKVAASTFYDAKSELAKFSASQTDKTQGAKVGSLNNSSSGTNAIAVLDRLVEITKNLPK
jgi:hypothetical protein